MATRKKSTALTSIQEERAKELETMQDRIQKPSGNKISTRNKQFNVPGQGVADELDIVILNFAAVNSFYEGAYDRENPAPPSCMAAGMAAHTGLTPFDNVPEPEAKSCGVCPNNEFGSAGKGKACKNTYLLGVIEPGADAEGILYTLSVPPTSIRAFDDYVSGLKKLGSLPVDVITKISMDESSDYVKLKFKADRVNDDVETQWARRSDATDILLAGPDFAPREPAPKKRRNKRAAA